MEYIWKKFPEEIIKGDNITESGFNYEEEYEKRVYKKVWMDIAWYCGRNGRRIFVLAVCRISQGASGKNTRGKQRGSSNNNPVKEETMATEGNGKVIHLTKAEFLAKVYNFEKNPEEWKYEGDKPAIVDFYADWCGPCKMVAPILDELAKEYDGQIVIYKVDTEKEQELAGAFGIRSIPSILFIPMEGKPEMAQGAMPKASFKKAIDEFLLKK